MNKRLRITCAFPEDDKERALWVEELSEALPGCEVATWSEGAAPADYAVVWKPSQAFIDAQQGLKAIFNAGAGVDALAALNIPVSTPLIRLQDAGMADQMIEYVVHAVLHHYREFDTYAAQAARTSWIAREPRIKSDYPVGILGFGILGQAVGKALSGLGFDVQAWASTPRPDSPIRVSTGDAELPAFLASTRILVCLLPLTPKTNRILDRKLFDLMQAGGYLVNVARGAHLCANDLLDALNAGRLHGATLDVFDLEPLPASDALWQHPRVRVTPHISAATLRSEAIAQIVGKIHAIERGEPVAGLIERKKGY